MLVSMKEVKIIIKKINEEERSPAGKILAIEPQMGTIL